MGLYLVELQMNQVAIFPSILRPLSSIKNNRKFGIDIRIPVLADKDALVARLREIAASYQLSYEEFDYLAPLYVPLDSPLVSSLMAVYQEETGDKTPAMSSGGATFARTMEIVSLLGLFSQVQNRPSTKPMNEQKLTISMLRWKSIEKLFNA